MPREKRLVVVGTPHHITQRGNNRQAVFRSDADRHFYLKTLKAKCAQHNLRVLGYCFMTNHVHLIATPEHERDGKERLDDADPTPRAFRRLRHAIRSGTPYGDHAFVSSLEQRFARRLVPSSPGPKRAQAARAATL